MSEFINGDCITFMENCSDKFDLILTDIPYDGVNNARQRKSDPLRIINKSKADEITFDLNHFLDLVYGLSKGTIIIFCGTQQVSKIFDYFYAVQNTGGGTVRQLVWHKTNPSPMNGQHVYLSAIENAVWFRKHGATFNGFCKHNIFEYPCGDSKFHPTEKNHELIAELIEDNSKVGDTIFDPCAGSGSTLLMARKMGRNFVGCELDRVYYEKASVRLTDEEEQINIFDLMKGKTE